MNYVFLGGESDKESQSIRMSLSYNELIVCRDNVEGYTISFEDCGDSGLLCSVR